MANRRQQKKQQKKAQKELERRREQQAMLNTLGMSNSEKAAINTLIKKTEAEEAQIDHEVEKEMQEETKKAINKIKIPSKPPPLPEPPIVGGATVLAAQAAVGDRKSVV